MAYGDYPALDKVRRVLVIKLRHLGDVLLTGPVFSALKARLPEASIDAYVYEEARPILEGHPAVRRIIGYDRTWKKLSWIRRLFKEICLLWEIRRGKYDLIFNLTEGDRGAMAARWSKAAIRVGIDSRRCYTHVAKICVHPRHTVERQLDAVRRIGLFPPVEERELFFDVPKGAIERVRQITPWKEFILIHPGSKGRFKCWPTKKMRNLALKLMDLGWKLVFVSGPDEAEKGMVAEIVAGLDVSKVCNLAGEVSLKELGALIKEAAVLLCVDSVSLHIASALKAPVVVLFGPSSAAAWGPWRNPRARVVAEAFSCRPCFQDGCGGGKVSDCLEAISVGRVLSELELVAKINTPRSWVADELIDCSR